MRKILFLVLALSVFVVTNASAAGQAYLWGGYTTVNMEDLNDSFRDFEKTLGEEQLITLHGVLLEAHVEDAEVSKIKGAFIGGIDYLFDINENGTIKVGPRLAFLTSK